MRLDGAWDGAWDGARLEDDAGMEPGMELDWRGRGEGHWLGSRGEGRLGAEA